jgi:hypothetical protein
MYHYFPLNQEYSTIIYTVRACTKFSTYTRLQQLLYHAGTRVGTCVLEYLYLLQYFGFGHSSAYTLDLY